MTSKHTPGPWIYFSEAPAIMGLDTEDGTQSVEICIFPEWFDEYKSEQWANAALIAAAPDLLEALEELNKIMEDGCGVWTIESQRRARAAIAKAKGETT